MQDGCSCGEEGFDDHIVKVSVEGCLVLGYKVPAIMSPEASVHNRSVFLWVVPKDRQ